MNDVENLEVDIDQAKSAVAMKEAIVRLQSNKDFNLVVNNGYFKKEPVRLVLWKADPSARGEEMQQRIMDQIDSIGNFYAFLQMTIARGAQMEQALVDSEAELSAVREEDEI